MCHRPPAALLTPVRVSVGSSLPLSELVMVQSPTPNTVPVPHPGLLGIRRTSWLVLAVATVFYVIHFVYTQPLEHNPDSGSHIAYIRYVAEHHAVPAASVCSECHHPPAYYLVAGALWRALADAGVTDPARGVQLLSIVLFLAFAVVSAASIARLVSRPYQQVLATALVALWPYSILNSTRISNDVALYATSAFAFYFLVRWYQDGKTRWMAAAAAVAALSLFIKESALTLVASLVAVAFLGIWRAKDRRRVARRAVPLVAALMLVAGLQGVLRGNQAAGILPRVLGSAYKPQSSELAPRTLRAYLTFDVKAFVSTPYALAAMRTYRSLEPTYWNHLLKSSLLGTRNQFFFRMPNAIDSNEHIALALNYALLALTAFLALALVLTWKHGSACRPLCFVAVAGYVAVGLAFHIVIPAGHHADFRFIFPVVVPMSVLLVDAMDALRRRGSVLWHGGYLVGNVFMALSLWYFLPMELPRRTFASPRPAATPATAPRPGSSIGPPRPHGILLPLLRR